MVRAALPVALALPALVLPALSLPALADTLSCPAALICREGLCETASGDEGARLVSDGTGFGLSSDGAPVRVTAVDLGGGVTRYQTSDKAEMIAIRSADLAFDYRRQTPRGDVQFKGNCAHD